MELLLFVVLFKIFFRYLVKLKDFLFALGFEYKRVKCACNA